MDSWQTTIKKQLAEGYGSGVVKKLSVDLKIEFPDMGVSPRNLWDMKRFYERNFQSTAILRQLVAVLPWGHNLLLASKVKPWSVSPPTTDFEPVLNCFANF